MASDDYDSRRYWIKQLKRVIGIRIYKENKRLLKLKKMERGKAKPITSTDWYRMLRGTVIHVIPRVEIIKPIHCGRRAAPKLLGGVIGICNWCGQECERPNRWHPYCRLWYWIMGDGVEYPHGRSDYIRKYDMIKWDTLIPRTECKICLDNTVPVEVDHIVSVACAARMGKREFIRAFFLSNTQWICKKCHRKKTHLDNIKLKEIKKAQGAPVLPPRWGINAPIQFPGWDQKFRDKQPGRIYL